MYTLILSAIAGVLAEYYKQPIFLTREALISEATAIWVRMSHLAGNGQSEHTVSALANKYGHDAANIIMNAFMHLEYGPLDNGLYVYRYGITPTKVTISAAVAIAAELGYMYSYEIKNLINKATDYCAKEIIKQKITHILEHGDWSETSKLDKLAEALANFDHDKEDILLLAMAVGRGNKAFDLIINKIDVNAIGGRCDTPFSMLSINEIDVNAPGSRCGAPFSMLISLSGSGRFQTVYNAGANIAMKNANGRTLLDLIVSSNDMHAILFLEEKQDAFFLSELKTNEELKLIHRNAHLFSLIKSMDSTLSNEEKEQKIQELKKLIDAGANLDFRDWGIGTPLSLAFESCNVEAAKLLVEAGATNLPKAWKPWCDEINSYLKELETTGHHKVFYEFHE